MRYDPSERFRTGGLGEIPWWRWVLYTLLFGIAVGFLGFKTDRFLLYAAPIAAVFIVGTMAGIGSMVRNPSIRAWILGNLWWIIPLLILMQIGLFIWDRIEERKQHGASNTASHGTLASSRP